LDKNFIEKELRIFAKEQTILLMQNNQDSIAILKSTLDQFYKDVVVVTDMEHAKRAFIEREFDLVVISVDFENRYGGLKAATMVRDRDKHQVIILNGDTNSNLDTDMFIELLEVGVATYIPHMLSIEFVMMKIMEQTEKLVYTKIEHENRKEIKSKVKEQKQEKIKSKKENTQQSQKYLANIYETHQEISKNVLTNKISAIEFIGKLAQEDNFKLLKYTIDNLNDLHFDFEKLIFKLVNAPVIQEELIEELVNTLFDYEDSLAKIKEFDKLAHMFGILAYYIDSVKLENINPRAFDIIWYLNDDLRKLVQHIFIKKDVDNIHFLDESIVSSLQQLKDNFDKSNIDSSDEDDIEMF
jgi:DNA-binding response OmpR family regulator